MNETIQTILTRRSTRGFQSEQLSSETLETILNCGLYAPSAMNRQAWHFTVVQNEALLHKLSEAVKAVLPESVKARYLARHNGDENFSVFYGAPTVIFISGESEDSYTPLNLGLAAENLCLGARALGVASCIIGLAALLFQTPQADAWRQTLQIPEGYSSLCAISFGYAAQEMPTPERIPGKVTYIR